EMPRQRREVDARVERRDAPLVQVDSRIEELERLARENYPDVDELGALDLRHDAHDRVIIGVSVHESPPRRTRAGTSAGSRDISHTSAARRAVRAHRPQATH